MANTITLNQTDLALVDLEYKKAGLVAPYFLVSAEAIGWIDAQTVRVNKIVVSGLSNHNRTGSGTPNVRGTVSMTKQTRTLERERSAFYELDDLDTMENPQFEAGLVLGEHMRTQVVPENDAFTVSEMYQNAGTTVLETLTNATILTAIDTAAETMNDAEVPVEDRLLFVSNNIYTLLKNSTGIDRQYYVNYETTMMVAGIERRVMSFDGMPVIPIPRARFWTQIDLDDPGFAPTPVTARGINFIMVHRRAVLEVLKSEKAVITSLDDSSENGFGTLLKHRIYCDTIIWDNKEPGIYASADDTITP